MGKQSTTEELKVLTLNTWGLLYISQDLDERMTAIGDELSKGMYDLVFLQEVWSVQHYIVIRDKVQEVLPYSHYYRSGFLGSGCATFSKFPIVDTLYHKYSMNGYFWDILHCDWYAGKGVAYAAIQHPSRLLYTFNTHLHADDPKQNNCVGVDEVRTLQCFQLAQFVKVTTRPGDAVIVSGDMNHVPNSLGIKTISLIASLTDTYNIAPIIPNECNTVNKEFNKYLPENEITSRLDYIFVSDTFECNSCNLVMQKVPNSDLHYSDHEGYSASLRFKPKSEESGVSFPEPQGKHTKVSNAVGEVLYQLLSAMKKGEKMSNEINMIKTAAIIISFIFFTIIPPILPDDLNFFFFFNSHFFSSSCCPQLIHILQVIGSVVSTIVLFVYLWVIVVIRQINVSEFKAVVNHIENKIQYSKEFNSTSA